MARRRRKKNVSREALFFGLWIRGTVECYVLLVILLVFLIIERVPREEFLLTFGLEPGVAGRLAGFVERETLKHSRVLHCQLLDRQRAVLLHGVPAYFFKYGKLLETLIA